MPSEHSDIRVVVVADDHLARAGLAALLAEEPGCTVAGQVAGEEFDPTGLEPYRADVAVWDPGWDPAASLDRLADLRDHGPLAVVLVADDTAAAEAWAAGARGVLHRQVDAAALMSALVAVNNGLEVVDPDLAAALPPAPDQAAPTSWVELTPREREVLALMADGLPNKAIARRLTISEHTVKFHVNSIFNKLGAWSRTEAVALATRAGLVTL